MLQLDVPGVLVHRAAVLLGVDELLVGGVADTEGRLGIAHVAEGRGAGGQGLEGELADGVDALGLQVGGEAPVGGGLELVGQALRVVHQHLVDVVHLERGEDVVLVGDGELVARQGHVALRGEGEVVDGELLRQVLLRRDGVGELGVVVVLVRLRAVGVVALGEEVGIEVGGGLSAHAEAQTVVEVLRDEGVDRADVELAGIVSRAGLEVVLEEGLQHEDGVFEALELLEVVEESAHAGLALGELHLTVLGPELVAAVVGAGLELHGILLLEALVGQGIEGEAGLSRRAGHHALLYPVGEHQFHDHVVDGEEPLAVRLAFKLLHALHRLHPVHVARAGDVELAALHLVMIGGVGDDVDLSAETEVLLVIG